MPIAGDLILVAVSPASWFDELHLVCDVLWFQAQQQSNIIYQLDIVERVSTSAFPSALANHPGPSFCLTVKWPWQTHCWRTIISETQCHLFYINPTSQLENWFVCILLQPFCIKPRAPASIILCCIVRHSCQQTLAVAFNFRQAHKCYR